MFFVPESSIGLFSSIASLQRPTPGQISYESCEAYDYSITFHFGLGVCKRTARGDRRRATGLRTLCGKQGFCSGLRFIGPKDICQRTAELACIGPQHGLLHSCNLSRVH